MITPSEVDFKGPLAGDIEQYLATDSIGARDRVHQRRGDRGALHHTLGRSDDERRAITGHQDDPVGERHHPLQTVLRHHDGQTEIVHQAGQCAQDLLGCGRVEDLTLETPLMLPEQAGVRIQVSVGGPGDCENGTLMLNSD